MGCTCYVEGGIFACTGRPAILDIPRNAGIPITPIPPVPFNFKFVDCYKADGTVPAITLSGGATNPGTITAPDYTYTVYPSSQVVAAVTNPTCGAGATLQVTAQGILSSACGITPIAKYEEPGFRCYPSLVENTLKIDLPETGNGITNINIYSVNGQNVFSFSKKTFPLETVELNLEKLKSGVYFVTIKYGKSVINRKFIKK